MADSIVAEPLGPVCEVRRRPPCPGGCNRAFRAHEDRRAVEVSRVHAGVWASWGGGWSLEADPELAQGHGRRSGDPHWCQGCQTQVLEDLARFPDLAAGLWQTGNDVDEPTDDRGRPPLHAVVETALLPGKTYAWIDTLACPRRHTFTYLWHPPLSLPPAFRRCSQCALDWSALGAGKIQSSAAGRGQSSRSGSPSGSASWDAIDELVNWAGWTEDRLRGYLHHARDWRDPRVGSKEQRGRTLTRSVGYLLQWGRELLALPEGIELGRQIRRLKTRAERAAAEDRLVHHLPAVCPVCDMKTLQREDGSDVVSCRVCKTEWQPEEYQWMVRTSVEAQRA